MMNVSTAPVANPQRLAFVQQWEKSKSPAALFFGRDDHFNRPEKNEEPSEIDLTWPVFLLCVAGIMWGDKSLDTYYRDKVLTPAISLHSAGVDTIQHVAGMDKVDCDAPAKFINAEVAKHWLLSLASFLTNIHPQDDGKLLTAACKAAKEEIPVIGEAWAKAHNLKPTGETTDEPTIYRVPGRRKSD